MTKAYSEIKIKAPFMLIKGFLMGYMLTTNKEFHYFFHKKHGIKREGTGGLMRELFHIDCHTHLCLPNDIVPSFKAALEKAKDKMCSEVESIKQIKEAYFTFSFHNYDEKETSGLKDLFHEIPEDIELENYSPLEMRSDGVDGLEYGTINPYVFEGNGTAHGEFDGIIDLYMRIKQHHLTDSILCSEIKLKYD